MPHPNDAPNIIAFSGSHGTGKTTAMLDYAAKAKKTGSGNVGVLQETARDCPYPVLGVSCERPSELSQLWIFSAQINRELTQSKKYDWLISDRTIVDCIAYTVFGGHFSLAASMMQLARQYMQRYHMVIFKSVHKNPYCLPDGFRSLDFNVRAKIEDILLTLYSELGVDLQ